MVKRLRREGECAFDQVGATLDVIECLQPELVIPGHGHVFGGAESLAAALARARSRLAALMKDPVRHAAHAAKVLIKFKLLEWQSVAEAHFFAWASATTYIRLVHGRFFADQPLEDWLEGLLAELVRSRAVARHRGSLCNI